MAKKDETRLDKVTDTSQSTGQSTGKSTGQSTGTGYNSPYAGDINRIQDQLLNREAFSYDVNSDAMYQNLKDQYVSGGKMAMMDTMGQAAALTGGYGNSYAQGAGQQAYQNYLTGLTDQIPDLYNMALQNYIQQGDQLAQQYGILTDREEQEYNRYMENQNATRSQALEMISQGVRPSDEMIAAAGLSTEYVNAMLPEESGSGGGWDPLQDAIDGYWAQQSGGTGEGGQDGGGTEPTDPINIYGDVAALKKSGKSNEFIRNYAWQAYQAGEISSTDYAAVQNMLR